MHWVIGLISKGGVPKTPLGPPLAIMGQGLSCKVEKNKSEGPHICLSI